MLNNAKVWLMVLVVVGAVSGCIIQPNRGTSSTIPQSATGQTSGSAIVVVNNSSDSVCRIFFSPASTTQWGPDQLGTETLSAGRSIGWSVNPGTWDIKLTDCDGNVLATQMGVEVGGSPVAFQYN